MVSDDRKIEVVRVLNQVQMLVPTPGGVAVVTMTIAGAQSLSQVLAKVTGDGEKFA